MKIGIITYHRAENYGALLQAYALRTYLQSQGHDVSFVDYWPDYHVNYFKVFSWKRFKGAKWKVKVKYMFESLIWMKTKNARRKSLQRFINERLGITDKPCYNEKTKATERYDVVVYGSDQIWRKQNMGGVGFDDWYFGADNVVSDKRIVYAGSMGTVKTTPADDAYIKKMMLHFKAISVREADLQEYLQSQGVESKLVVDPVFLLSKEQWLMVAEQEEKKEKYILFYNLLNNKESAYFAERLSEKTGLPIKEINKKMSFKHLGERYISGTSVAEFLRLILDAEYVVSNSFHGVAFSLIFQKRVYAVGMGAKANRVISLLEMAGIPERYIQDGMAYLPLATMDIDYQLVNNNLHRFVEDSKLFLKNA